MFCLLEIQINIIIKFVFSIYVYPHLFSTKGCVGLGMQLSEMCPLYTSTSVHRCALCTLAATSLEVHGEPQELPAHMADPERPTSCDKDLGLMATAFPTFYRWLGLFPQMR